MKFLRTLVFNHNLRRARYFKRERDEAEYQRNTWDEGDPEWELADERFTYCDRALSRYLRALGQEA